MRSKDLTSSTYVRPLEESNANVTVLCVAPDEAWRSTVADGLEAADERFRVLEAPDAPTAFDLLRAEDVGCVVSALDLPATDGVAFLEGVRDEFDELPFVLLTDGGDEQTAAEAVNAGADGYVAHTGRSDESVMATLVDRIDAVVESYRSHQRFREATGLLFRLTEYTNDTLWMFTGDWSETVVVNDAYEDIWKRPVENVVGDPSDFLDGVHPGDRDTVGQKMERLSGGEKADLEFRVESGDGDTRCVSVHAEPVFDDDGDVAYVAGFTRDISERRERERREREANQHLETLVENLPVVVFTFDPDGTFTQSAGKGLEALGLERGDLQGESVYEAYADNPDIVDAVDRALDGEEVRATQHLPELGLVFETWYQPVFDAAGDLDKVVAVSRDVTELKHREQRMQDVTEATRELPHARSEAEVARVVVDIVDSVIGCPITAYWTYDAEQDALLPVVASEDALDVADAEAPETLHRIEDGHDEMAVFRDGELTVVENYGALSNPSNPGTELGTLLLVPVGDHGMLNVGHASLTEVDEFDRHLVEILGQTATDALDRVKRERELERQRTELERSNESLQQFAYVASHDLQEPLRMVSSYVSLLESEYGDAFDEEAEEYMAYAVDGAKRMQEMIDALLQYSRVQTRAEEFAEVDAATVYEETVQSLGLLVDEEDATVSAGELPEVEADRNQLRQLLQNLIKNGVQHAGEEPTVTVEATEEDGTIHFTVSDDGPGIDPSQHEKIFEIFKQNSTRRDSTGIGLAMCERIVTRHGGDIWVESSPGEGATFHFTLPAPADAGAGATFEHTTATDGGHE